MGMAIKSYSKNKRYMHFKIMIYIKKKKVVIFFNYIIGIYIVNYMCVCSFNDDEFV